MCYNDFGFDAMLGIFWQNEGSGGREVAQDASLLDLVLACPPHNPVMKAMIVITVSSATHPHAPVSFRAHFLLLVRSDAGLRTK